MTRREADPLRALLEQGGELPRPIWDDGSSRPDLALLRGALYRFTAAERHLVARYARVDGTMSLDGVRALNVLMGQTAVTAGEFARAAELSPSRVSAMLDKLEADGIVLTRVDEGDRRVRWVSLAARGRREVQRHQAQWNERFADAFADLTDRKVRAATRVMERIALVFESIAQPGSPGATPLDDGPAPLPAWAPPDADDRRDLELLRAAGYRLTAAERRLIDRYKRAGGTMSPARIRALAVLMAEQEAKAGDLARAADLRPASVTSMLAQLEDQGVLTTRRDPNDRRVRWVSLTLEGRAEMRRNLDEWNERFTEAFAGTPDSDLRAATLVLERLARIFQAVASAN
jgi:DNA-binding MarR family transcriptional regulator